MSQSLIWTSTAANDLVCAIEYEREQEYERAIRLIEAVEAAESRIQHQIDCGSYLTDIDRPNHRELLILRKYRLIYRFDLIPPLVTAFVHSARHLPQILRQRPEQP